MTSLATTVFPPPIVAGNRCSGRAAPTRRRASPVVVANGQSAATTGVRFCRRKARGFSFLCRAPDIDEAGLAFLQRRKAGTARSAVNGPTR
jgi:hypothetical protein